MAWTPYRLTARELAQLAVLFLARRAPLDREHPPATDGKNGVVPRYHFELLSVLRDLGLSVESADSLDRLFRRPPSFNYVFSLFNRAPFRHSEVFASAVCEYLQVAYLGARPHARALAEDKHLTKIVAGTLQIPTPRWEVYNLGATRPPPSFPGPYLVKPRFGAASEGITADSLQEEWSGARRKVNECHEQGWDAIVEEFIPGDNVTTPVLFGSRAYVLPSIHASSTTEGGILTFQQKRLLEPGLTRAVYPAGQATARMATYSRRFASFVAPVDYFRADYRVTGDLPFLLEVNICCNLGSHSSVTLAAQHVGISQADLVNHIMAHSVRRQYVLRE